MKTVKVPDSWSEVTIGQYQEIASLEEDKTDNTISILIDEDIEVVKKMTPESYRAISSKLEWVIKAPDETRYNLEVKAGSKTFYFKDLNKLTIGERIDLDNYCKDYVNNLHKIFAVFYREEHGKRSDPDFFKNNVMIGDVYGALVFFSIIGTKSIPIIQNYLTLRWMKTKRKKKERKD